jgi:hypothetical protein
LELQITNQSYQAFDLRWHVLLATWLGMLFDGLDASIYVLTLYPCCHEQSNFAAIEQSNFAGLRQSLNNC